MSRLPPDAVHEGTELRRPSVKDTRRFWKHVDVIPDASGEKCWIWKAYKDRKGYGQFSIGGVMRWAHRVSYAIAHGLLPAGWTVDHVCKNPSCVRPEHLRKQTHAENSSKSGREQTSKEFEESGMPY